MSIEAWPFLVSRNRYLDYRTVVAPKFICETGIYNLLARVAEGDLTQSGCAYIRRVKGSKAGDFSIIFQVVEATEKDINPEGGNQVIKDQFGREIYLLEGIVLKQSGNVIITQEDIEKAHDMLVISYRQFWNWTASRSAIPSEAFLLGMNGASLGLKLEELKPFPVVSKAPATEPPITENAPPQLTSYPQNNYWTWGGFRFLKKTSPVFILVVGFSIVVLVILLIVWTASPPNTPITVNPKSPIVDQTTVLKVEYDPTTSEIALFSQGVDDRVNSRIEPRCIDKRDSINKPDSKSYELATAKRNQENKEWKLTKEPKKTEWKLTKSLNETLEFTGKFNKSEKKVITLRKKDTEGKIVECTFDITVKPPPQKGNTSKTP